MILFFLLNCGTWFSSKEIKLTRFSIKQTLYGTNILVTSSVQVFFVVICTLCGVFCASCLVLCLNCPQRRSAEAGRVLPGWLELLQLSHLQLFINASLNTPVLSPLAARLTVLCRYTASVNIYHSSILDFDFQVCSCANSVLQLHSRPAAKPLAPLQPALILLTCASTWACTIVSPPAEPPSTAHYLSNLINSFHSFAPSWCPLLDHNYKPQ